MGSVDTSYEAVKLFIETEDDIDMLINTKTMSRYCITQGAFESLKLLVDCGCSTGTLISGSISNSRREIFDYLLTQNIDIDETPGSQQNTPINFSVQLKHTYFIKKLLEHGADVSIPDSKDCLPIFHAARMGSEDIVRLLLEYKSPITYLDVEPCPLLVSIAEGHYRIASMLLEAGANPNSGTDEIPSPLSMAIEKEARPMINLLLALGAETRGIDLAKIPPTIQTIFDKWNSHPLPEGNEICFTLLDTLNKALPIVRDLSDSFKRSIAEIDSDHAELTFVLGSANTFILKICEFVKKVVSSSKKIYKERSKYIKQQHQFFSNEEMRSLDNSFKNNEQQWKNLAKKSMEQLKSSQDEFAQTCLQQLTKMLERMPQDAHDVFDAPVPDHPDYSQCKTLRGRLLFLNEQVGFLKKIIADSYAITKQSVDTYLLLIDKIEATLDGMTSAINKQLQLDVDFRISHPEAVLPPEATKALTECRTKLDSDRAYIKWTRSNMNAMAKNMYRLLKHVVM